MAANIGRVATITGCFLIAAYWAKGLLKKDKISEFDAEQLKSMRMHNEHLTKLISIMDNLNTKGLFHAIKQYVPQDNFESFVNTTVFSGFTKASTRLCECKIPQVFAKIAHDIFKEKYDAELPINTKLYMDPHTGAVTPLTNNMMLKHIAGNPEAYKALLEGDTLIIKVNKAYFTSNTYDVDYDRLDQVVRKDAEGKLQNSMSCNDFTYLERLNVIEQTQWNYIASKSSNFKNDLVELHKYYYDPEANKHLVEQIYSSENYD